MWWVHIGLQEEPGKLAIIPSFHSAIELVRLHAHLREDHATDFTE